MARSRLCQLKTKKKGATHLIEVKKNTCMYVWTWTYPVADLGFVVAGIFGFPDPE
jgi:hypothetical protein